VNPNCKRVSGKKAKRAAKCGGIDLKMKGDGTMLNRKKIIVMITAVLVSMSGTAWATTYYVDPGGSDDANGLSWATAFATIQKGIDTANSGDIVDVNEGTYVENTAFDGNNITLTSTDPNDWDVVAATIIDANGSGTVVTFGSGEDANCVLAGFTITDGQYGVSCSNSSSPEIRNCIIEDNNSHGIYCTSGSPEISNNKIGENGGDGIYTSATTPPTIKNNWIYDNDKGIEFSSATSAATVRTNTIADNTVSGIYVASGNEPDISNCIVWDCNDDLYGCTATYSCIEDGDSGTGNISSYPYFEEVDMGADELNTELNLVLNPGFELGGGGDDWQGNPSNDVPLYWQQRWGCTDQYIDSNEQHSGSYSWKVIKDVNQANRWSGGHSNYTAVGQYEMYKASTWMKSQSGDETLTLYVSEMDADQNGLRGYTISYKDLVPTYWKQYWGIFRTSNDPNLSDMKIDFYVPAPKTTGTAWCDDFSLTRFIEFLSPYGCVNEPNVAETVKFGSNGLNENWVKGTITDYMSDPCTDSNDSEITYRELKNGKTVTIEFPAFNLDPGYDPNDPNDMNSLPLTPMLVEVMYKDTVYVDQSKTASSSQVFVYSKIDYINLDSWYLVEPNDRDWGLRNLGGLNDDQWRYAQYGFQKSHFQLIRAIDGKYTIKIENKAGSDMPIDYVSLRKITEAECEALKDKQREFREFYEVLLPANNPADPNYSDPNITVFARDIMRPVYQHTQPGPNEIDPNITGFSVWGEVEPVSFSIYSENGINDLTIENSNLTHSDGNTIDGNDISIYHVIYDETRLGYVSTNMPKSYALVPDRLEEFTTLSVDANTSERVWLKIQVPDKDDGLPAGLYEGNVYIKQDANTLKTIPVDFNVYDITLERPGHISPVYHDPLFREKVYSNDLNEVYDAFTETDFDPITFSGNYELDISIDANDNLVFDSNLFEKRLDRMINEGFAKDFVIVPPLWAKAYEAVYGSGPNLNDPNLWSKLSDSNFKTKFKTVIDKYVEIGDGYINNDPNNDKRNITFLYLMYDEPWGGQKYRIVTDRIFTIIIEDCNQETISTYGNGAEYELDPGIYNIPAPYGPNVPPMTNVVTHKAWQVAASPALYLQHHDNPNYYGHFGYYTTGVSHYPSPVYNRFLHGLFACATDATSVLAYAMGDYGDPYDDFDGGHKRIFQFSYPDFLFAYPTWSGELLYAIGGLEGIREGIKDAKYIATLKARIATDPNTMMAALAQGYLDDLYSRIDPNYSGAYDSQETELGYYQAILEGISVDNDVNDFEAFTAIRQNVVNYITRIADVNCPNAPPAFYIKNGSAGFDTSGNLILRGSLEQNTTPTATANDEFRVQDSNGTDVAIIDMTNGNMYIKGTLYEEQVTLTPSASSDDFIIKDSSGDVIAYIDESGNVYLKGKLYDN